MSVIAGEWWVVGGLERGKQHAGSGRQEVLYLEVFVNMSHICVVLICKGHMDPTLTWLGEGFILC